MMHHRMQDMLMDTEVLTLQLDFYSISAQQMAVVLVLFGINYFQRLNQKRGQQLTPFVFNSSFL